MNTQNLTDIKNFIFKENSLNKDEQKILTPMIEFLFKTDKMDLSKFNLDMYKRYIKMKDKKEFVNENSFDNIENLEDGSSLFKDFVQKNKRILIITDNDLDGTSANAIAKSVKLFIERKFNRKNLFTIEFAYGSNHGISFQHVNDILGDSEEEVLIVTADNGINNREEILLINEKYPNSKIIITDHHKANEEDHVFDLVDYVINPEAIEVDKVSKSVTFNIKELGDVKTSISGGHTFYLLIKKALEKLKVKNDLLNQEIYLIALFSDVGDLINYHLDIANDLELNMVNFEKKMFLFQHYIDNLDKFSTVPNKERHNKIKDYFGLNISIFNAVRRLNSLLMSLNDFDKDGNTIEKWFKENFALDVKTIKINDYHLDEYINRLNDKAKRILEHFGDSTETKYNFYSFIKNVVPYALLSNNQLKTKEDEVFINEIVNIINDLNSLKKTLRLHILNNKLYSTFKTDNVEVYFSDIGSILREILTIQVFIEKGKNKPYFNLAINKSNNEAKGSLRTPKFFPLKKLLLEDERVQKVKEKHDITIKITGHDEAAGINFNFVTKSDTMTQEHIFEFVKDLDPIFEDVMKEKEDELELDSIPMDLMDLNKFNADKLLYIINNYLYVSHHPFISKPSFDITLGNFKELLGVHQDNNIEMMVSKRTGNKYLSKNKENVSIVYFGDEDKLKQDNDTMFNGSYEFKYNNRERKFNITITMN